MTLKPYQTAFIDFLIKTETLCFGDFVTKSGRKTPYFINTGKIHQGQTVAELGSFYAAHIVESQFASSDVLFGPAYKGIPLCVSTAIALAQNHQKNLHITFNRKEEKKHGDKGNTVGHTLQDGDAVTLIEDVITAGTTLREVVPMIKELANVKLLGVIIAVDRCEKGAGEASAKQESEQEHGIKIEALVSIDQIISYLSTENTSGFTINAEQQAKINDYLATYGVL